MFKTRVAHRGTQTAVRCFPRPGYGEAGSALVSVSDDAMLAAQSLFPALRPHEPLSLIYRAKGVLPEVGHACLQFSIVGATMSASENPLVWCHAFDLPAAFPLTMEELAIQGVSIVPGWHKTAADDADFVRMMLIGSISSGMASGDETFGAGEVLRQFLRTNLRQKHSVRGITESNRITKRFGRQGSERLSLTFPYYVGVGEETTKEYFDIGRKTLRAFNASFANALPPRHDIFVHGQRVLCRNGVATCIGCGVDSTMGEDGCALYWQCGGVPGAASIPELHVPPSYFELSKNDAKHPPAVVVGEMKVPPNGPVAATNVPEDVSRYLKTSGDLTRDGVAACDSSDWLCEGLFGLKAGLPVPGRPDFEVLGTALDVETDELVLYCRHQCSGKLASLEDVLLFH